MAGKQYTGGGQTAGVDIWAYDTATMAMSGGEMDDGDDRIHSDDGVAGMPTLRPRPRPTRPEELSILTPWSWYL